MTRRTRRRRKSMPAWLMQGQDDLLLVIFSFVDFPTLIRIQRVSTYWMMIAKLFISYRLGSKPFMTPLELRLRINQYCDKKVEFAVEIASIYGWPIGKWDVSQVTDFSFTFVDHLYFNEDIGDWDVSNATRLYSMFSRAKSFNQDLSKWNTLNVTDMSRMFLDATSFNGDITEWKTSQVTRMSDMFSGAKSFNQDIAAWDVSNVVDMNRMFAGARSFRCNISSWDVANVTDCKQMLANTRSFYLGYSPRFEHLETPQQNHCILRCIECLFGSQRSTLN